jgi:hypothetical protein
MSNEQHSFGCGRAESMRECEKLINSLSNKLVWLPLAAHKAITHACINVDSSRTFQLFKIINFAPEFICMKSNSPFFALSRSPSKAFQS